MKYGPALREAILRRILPPNSEPLSKVARDSGICLQTLFNWKNQAIADGLSFPEETETEKFSSQEKFRIVVESEALNETELAEYARSKGVYVEQLRQTKTRTYREVPVKPDFLEKLRKMKEDAKSDYVIEFRGKRVGSIRMAFVRAVKRSGIGKDFRIHDLRHIYATYMLNNGADLAAVSSSQFCK